MYNNSSIKLCDKSLEQQLCLQRDRNNNAVNKQNDSPTSILKRNQLLLQSQLKQNLQSSATLYPDDMLQHCDINGSLNNVLLTNEIAAYASTSNPTNQHHQDFNNSIQHYKRKNQDQQAQPFQSSSKITSQQMTANNQLKQFQYQQQLINQQHLKQIKLQQQQQQKHHLMYQQQQEQTQLNILNHNQNLTGSSATTVATVVTEQCSAAGPQNLVQIESEIQKTYNFYVQMLKERKEYLIKELNTIINYALLNNQTNINKQLKLQYQLEMKKQLLEKETEQELNELKVLTQSPQSTSSSKVSPMTSPLNNKESSASSSVNCSLTPNSTASSNSSGSPSEQQQQQQQQQQQLQQQNDQLTASILTQNLNNKLNSLTELNNLLLLNNQLINQLKNNNPLQSIEFLSNYSAIQTSIRNTFGYIRINQQQAGTQQQQQQQQSSTSNTEQLTINCDTKSIKQQQLTINTLSNSTSKSCLSSLSSTTSSMSIASNKTDSMMSPISAIKSGNRPITNNNNHNHTLIDDADAESNNKIKFLFANDNNKAMGGATATWSTFLNNENNLLVSPDHNNNNNNMISNESDHNYAHHKNSVVSLSGGSNSSTKSSSSSKSSKSSLSAYNHHHHQNQHQHQQNNNHDLDGVYGNNMNAMEHYSLQQQQSKILATAATSTGLTNGSTPQLIRTKMIYHCKFGKFGINDGQFTEPSGVTINTNNDIIVADTNSHRIQIFDKDGRFKFKFGECGKLDGQLLYPNRVSIVKQTGDIVVTERSPTHQIQIYNKFGQFLRKFGANILQHPRGVCVDYKGRIVVVECKVMRVLIFDLYGNVLQKFNCSKYLEFPNGVCCSNPTNNPSLNTPEEIYISDNRAHCIKVFDYNGNFIRQIGGEGITNYPIGVGINSNNEILVADNHNNFNLSVFSQDGQLINALESKVKHAQCFDVGLMDDGSIVLASKDYRIYVYKYMASTTTNSHHLVAAAAAASQTSPNQIKQQQAAASSSNSFNLMTQTNNNNNNNNNATSAGIGYEALFNLFTNANTMQTTAAASNNKIQDQNLSKCSNNEDQNVIDNFEVNLDDNLMDPVHFLTSKFLDKLETSGFSFDMPPSIDLFDH
jgi:tripartite motif-containing protein 2/3